MVYNDVEQYAWKCHVHALCHIHIRLGDEIGPRQRPGYKPHRGSWP